VLTLPRATRIDATPRGRLACFLLVKEAKGADFSKFFANRAKRSGTRNPIGAFCLSWAAVRHLARSLGGCSLRAEGKR